MRKFTMLLGLVLALGAVSALGYRWLHEPGRYARYAPNASSGWRSEPRSEGWREHRPRWESGRGDRSGLGGLRLFEIVVDVLNIVVGLAGIWLAVIGVHMQRSAHRQVTLRTDA